MVSFHSNPLRRVRNKTIMQATEAFWHAPVDASSDGGCSSASDSLSIPPAHHQLLSEDRTSFEDLKGYDHAARDATTDGYASDDVDMSFATRKLSAVKREGGGSWLLGFARLANETSLDGEEEEAPGLVRDDASLSDSEDSSSDSDDDSSVASSPSKPMKKRRSVGFASSVTVQPIPHSCTLTPLQRRKMFSSSLEVRQNKIRNKREYRYDGYDWRNATEEWEMAVDMVTGELVHPAHEA